MEYCPLFVFLGLSTSLSFSNKILNPIVSIILDSQKIISDNFKSRITVIKEKNEFNFLSKLLNQMLDSLAIQKNKLIKAEKDHAWAQKYDQKKLVGYLKKGSKAVMSAISHRNTVTKDTFMLTGFSDALSELEKRCKSN